MKATWATRQVACTASKLCHQLAATSPRETLLDALSALHGGSSCSRTLWLTVAVHCAAHAVEAVSDDRSRVRARGACESLGRSSSLLGSPAHTLVQQQVQDAAAAHTEGASSSPTLMLAPWACVLLPAAARLGRAGAAQSLPVATLSALLAVDDVSHVSDDAAALHALSGVLRAAGGALVPAVAQWVHGQGGGAQQQQQEDDDDDDGALAFPAAAALHLWVAQHGQLCEPVGVMSPLAQVQAWLPLAAAWWGQHGGGQHGGATAQRVVQSLAVALGGVAAQHGVCGARSSWPVRSSYGGPWLQLSTPVAVGEQVQPQHSSEPAAVVMRLLLTHMSLGMHGSSRDRAWGCVRELLGTHTPVARLWLLRVCLVALPHADVAALLWDGVRQHCVGEIKAPLPGGQGGFMTPLLLPLLLDMQERRCTSAWPRHDSSMGVLQSAPVHTACACTLRLLCVRAVHLVGGGGTWEEGDPSGLARYCACSQPFHKTYMQLLRRQCSTALQDRGVQVGSAAAASSSAAACAPSMPALAAGAEVHNSAVQDATKQDMGLLLQMEGALLHLQRQLDRLQQLMAQQQTPLCTMAGWGCGGVGNAGTGRPSAA